MRSTTKFSGQLVNLLTCYGNNKCTKWGPQPIDLKIWLWTSFSTFIIVTNFQHQTPTFKIFIFFCCRKTSIKVSYHLQKKLSISFISSWQPIMCLSCLNRGRSQLSNCVWHVFGEFFSYTNQFRQYVSEYQTILLQKLHLF